MLSAFLFKKLIISCNMHFVSCHRYSRDMKYFIKQKTYQHRLVYFCKIEAIKLVKTVSATAMTAATAIPESFGHKKAYLSSDSGTLSLLIHGQKITSCQVVWTSLTLPSGVATREAILETRFSSF